MRWFDCFRNSLVPAGRKVACGESNRVVCLNRGVVVRVTQRTAGPATRLKEKKQLLGKHISPSINDVLTVLIMISLQQMWKVLFETLTSSRSFT